MSETEIENEMDAMLSRMPGLAVEELRAAWGHAVRSYNACENAGLEHSCQATAAIIVKLSQQLEYAEAMQELSK